MHALFVFHFALPSCNVMLKVILEGLERRKELPINSVY
jgi:hypothetical protein